MTRIRGILFVVFVVLLGAAGCGPSRGLAELSQLGTTPDGLIFWLTFDGDGAPWIGLSTGLYRWDGTSWAPVTTAGLTELPSPYVRFDRAGNALAASAGTAFRLPRGGASWEALNTDGLLHQPPVEASDGTLYSAGKMDVVTGKSRVYFRKAGDTAWTDSGNDLEPVWWNPIADTKGNVWLNTWSGGGADDGVQRLHEREQERTPAVWGRATLGDVHALIGADAAGLYAASTNYASNAGEVYRWDPATKQRTTLADGSKCQPRGEAFTCEGGAFIYAAASTRAPNGDVYQLFAHQNGDPPALLVLNAGEDTWWPLLLDLVPGVAVAAGPDSALYLYGNLGDGTAVAKVLR